MVAIEEILIIQARKKGASFRASLVKARFSVIPVTRYGTQELSQALVTAALVSQPKTTCTQ